MEAGFEELFFGARVRDWVFTGVSKGFTERQVHVGYPALSEEYFEWISLLSAVATAGDRFQMFELGAGWGRWALSAAQLCRQSGRQFHIVAVEPEPSHFKWLQMSFQDNGIDPGECELWEGAVAGRNGSVRLVGAGDPAQDYGQSVLERSYGLPSGFHSRSVKAIGLTDLLKRHPSVDLIDMDIQGLEGQVLASVSGKQLRGVRMIHIGTHSTKQEETVRELFRRMGWLNAFSFPCTSESATPYGKVVFQDGVETWVNPESASLLKLIQSR